MGYKIFYMNSLTGFVRIDSLRENIIKTIQCFAYTVNDYRP